jgi:hypothetical protein
MFGQRRSIKDQRITTQEMLLQKADVDAPRPIRQESALLRLLEQLYRRQPIDQRDYRDAKDEQDGR